MPVLSGPHWLGSPQHLVVGVLLALAIFPLARRGGVPPWAAAAVAVGAVSAAEIVLELIEYPVLYADKFHASAYYDTLADMASSLAGALIGAALAVPLTRRFASSAWGGDVRAEG